MSQKIPLEIKAIQILEEYSGYNNYIIEMKTKLSKNSKFYPTRAQAQYIIDFNGTIPKIARKWVELDTYFSEKIATDRAFIDTPTKIWVEKLLVEKDKSYHIYGKFFDNDELTCIWLPKAAVIKSENVKANVDYSKYSHRPPLEHQKEAIEKLLSNNKFILADEMGLGKGLPGHTRIYTRNGFKSMRDIKLGDKVIGPNGLSYDVTGYYPQGVRDVYKIKFSDGTKIIADENHLWSVTVKGITKVVSTKDLLKTYHSTKHYIPITSKINFENEITFDPFTLGVLLSNSVISGNYLSLDINLNLYNKISEHITVSKKIKFADGLAVIINIDITNEIGVKNLYEIPKEYLYSNVNNRIALLSGILADRTKSVMNKNGEIKYLLYKHKSNKLLNNICELIQCLGGICKLKNNKLKIKLPNDLQVYNIENKFNQKKITRYIKSIKYDGKCETFCISVNSPDKLYVIDHAIVTHNTTSTILAALESGVKKILIICPATLKVNWEREIKNYSDRSVYICEGKKYSEDHDIVIMNYDIVKNFHSTEKNAESKILNSNFELLIIDEAHFLSNAQALRTKLINSFAKKINKVWLLTGTPITSRPINYFNLLNLIDSPVASNWMAYVIRYCEGYQFFAGKRKIWNTSGASNLEELKNRTSRHLLRRLKESVLDLPEKIITPTYLRLYSRKYEELMGEYFEWYRKKPEESSSLSVQFNKLMKVRQILAEEKVPNTIELAEAILAQGKKVIIFTNFTDSLQTILKHFGKKAVYVDGSCSMQKRQMAVDQFQTDDNIEVFIGNLIAAGSGITLTAAEAVIMNDLSFVPAHHLQAEDRAHRYGQNNSVSIYYPVFENTIEGVIYDILSNKKYIFETVMGDNTTNATEDILKNIINKGNN